MIKVFKKKTEKVLRKTWESLDNVPVLVVYIDACITLCAKKNMAEAFLGAKIRPL